MKASTTATRFLVAGAATALLPLAGAWAQTPPAAEPPADSQQGATFESLDTDGDGRISKKEAAANTGVSSQFSRYDQNGDGYIEKSEVSAANNPPSDSGK